jgi:magnesium-transporting ATPase (P-type)
MGKYELIATAALLLNFSSFSSLLYNVMTTHNTSTLPYVWFYTNIAAQVLMIIYALINGAYGIYIPTFILLIGLIYMLFIKMFYENDVKTKNNERNSNKI